MLYGSKTCVLILYLLIVGDVIVGGACTGGVKRYNFNQEIKLTAQINVKSARVSWLVWTPASRARGVLPVRINTSVPC